MYTGLNSDTPKRLLLDAGAFFKNYDLTKSYEQQTAGACIGATNGGGTFSAVPQVRKIALDGAKTNVKGLATIDQWNVTMTANVKELTADNLKLALGAAKSSTVASTDTGEAGVNGDTRIEGKADFEATDYVSNITWVGRLKGASTPVVIVMKNVIGENGLSINPQDKNEATVAITLTANYELTDLDEPPFTIYYPTVS